MLRFSWLIGIVLVTVTIGILPDAQFADTITNHIQRDKDSG